MTYGKLINVGEAKLNVYTEGNSDTTIIFMAGSGVSTPGLEYKPLYSLMSKQYRIAVVEKSGYGLSESTGTQRTVENIVEESRLALKNAGILPPYVLAPHSYSGLEAIWWANTYPDEVKALLSIDMIVPNMALAQAEEISEEKKASMVESSKRLYKKIAKQGFLAKLFKNKTENVSGMLTSNYLTDEEKQLYREMFYKNLLHEETFEEALKATDNAKTVVATGNLKAPAFFFISDMKSPVKKTTWRKASTEYAQSIGAEYEYTDAGHTMYAKIPQDMAKKHLEFLSKLNIK